MTSSILFHHYPSSPFSEKVRVLFGIKRLDWTEVVEPTIMPKPELTALTGGYRRIPVMQIGADIYCDTSVIMAELEERFAEPKLIHAADWMINAWADRLLFQAAVTIIFGTLGDRVPAAFIKDREALSGNSFDLKRMNAAVPDAKGQFRAMAAWIERALADGTSWLGGKAPSLADIASYMNIWFYRSALAEDCDALLADMPQLTAWRKRIAAIGHGTHTSISPAEALAVAAAAEPLSASHLPHDARDAQGLARGSAVRIMANDYGRDPIAGTLLAANRERLVIAREHQSVGRVHVHFPRAGFSLVSQ
jgi:glutathione S-transferase